MKRLVILALVATLVVLAAQAFAATLNYHGRVNGEHRSHLDFDVTRRHGENRRILNLTFARVKARCDEGRGALSGVVTFDPPLPVTNGREFEFDDGTLRFDGVFFDHGRKARGGFRYDGPVNQGAAQCDTGDDRYHVQR